MRRDFDIVIVGAGPAGLAAAIEAKKCNSKAKVAVLEKMEKAGKKLSASGNGRGNLSNRSCHELDEVL
ncbi:MAG: FAD-dependent oxidoreductase, partial [Firmicutes bacterium]|nr:FAD-dependent oxidoreductase [Bacillota bacterium]